MTCDKCNSEIDRFFVFSIIDRVGVCIPVINQYVKDGCILRTKNIEQKEVKHFVCPICHEIYGESESEAIEAAKRLSKCASA